MTIPDDLHYSKDHEWIRVEGEEAIIGITDFAQSELGDIIFVEFPKVGDKYSAGDTFGTVEAVKTVADLFMPVSGEILAVNSALDEAPEAVNEDPYQTGWLVKIEMTASTELDDLMDPEGYKAHLG
ncbi:MAG: glycine cleavage system protein GcvH [Candidatus Marinimicrobia bacterium]|nr:glycine cleavage system protein GcvH [Candidatus Neomarinimicrobiota bacterium]